MPKRRERYCSDVFGVDVGSAGEQRMNLGAEDHCLGAARARSVANEALDPFRGVGGARVRRATEACRVAQHRLSDRHFANERTERTQLFQTQSAIGGGDLGPSGPAQNLYQRVPTEPMRLFVDDLVQGEELGRPLADIFERQADQSRVRRVQDATDTAGKAKVLVLIPGMLVFISVLILLFAPFFVRWYYGGLRVG